MGGRALQAAAALLFPGAFRFLDLPQPTAARTNGVLAARLTAQRVVIVPERRGRPICKPRSCVEVDFCFSPFLVIMRLLGALIYRSALSEGGRVGSVS